MIKRMEKRSVGIATFCLLAGMVFLVQVQAQEDTAEQKSRRCLPMSQIDHIEVVDDQNIIFHMRGNRKYLNHLPYRCSGLKHNTLLHETSLNSYCDLDIIGVIDINIGMRLGSCPLGKFDPYILPDGG